MPGASTKEIQGKYDARAGLLRAELIAGAPSTLITAVSRAQQLLDSARRVPGDPATRARYDAAADILSVTRGGRVTAGALLMATASWIAALCLNAPIRPATERRRRGDATSSRARRRSRSSTEPSCGPRPD